eukprot:gene28680-34626_t
MSRISSEQPLKKKERIYKVPNIFQAYHNLSTANFLTLRDDEVAKANEQFIGENVNLALICALLVTTFLPLYYGETSRISVPDDGFSIDVSLGVFNRHMVHVSKEFMHDFFDITYVCATAGMFFGTLACVYFILVANEAGSNERTIILRNRLGLVARLPYFFFSVGAYSWGFSVYAHLVLVPRYTGGWIVKVTLVGLLTAAFAVWLLPTTVQALYASFAEEQQNPPKNFSVEELREQLQSYWDQVKNSGENNFNLDDFMLFLRPDVTSAGYRVPLLPGVQFDAARMFYEQLGREKGMTYEQVIQLVSLMGNLE